METSPTKGAADSSGWEASQGMARLVRFVAFVIPPLTGWLVVHLVSDFLLRLSGTSGLILWVAQATLLSAAVCLGVERLTRRLLPLAFLLNLSLVFPDQAPSRFGLALRAGNIKNLRARALDLHKTDNVNDVATAAVELVTALSSHDRRTRGHSERVRAYCDVIASGMGLSDHDRHMLAWGALLHDVGKLTVPSEVLNKKAKLTDAEWKQLQGHPGASRDMLVGLSDWLGDWLGAAGQHHERWDGGGYPDGLAGTEISLAGRITAVADAYDVITSKRSYKQAMSTEAARAELVRCAGDQFDPAVVRAFLEVSLGRRRPTGAFASLLELRTLTSVGSHASPGLLASTAAGMAVVASTATGILPGTDQPLAFVDQTHVIAATGDGVEDETTPELEQSGTPSSTLPGFVSTTQTESATTAELGTDPSSDEAAAPTTITDSTTVSVTATTGTTSSGATSGPTTSLDTSLDTSTAPSVTAGSSTTTLPSTTTTTVPATTTTAQPSGPLVLYLSNPGTGNTSSSNPLTLIEVAPNASSLANYDTNRDSAAGLGLAKDGAGLGTNDSTKRQEWEWIAPSNTSLQGDVTVRLWVGAKDQNSGEGIGVLVRLQLCNPGCSTVGTDSWSATSTSAQGTLVELDLGSIGSTISSGSVLRLKVVVPDNLASTDIVLSYDSATYPARIRIG